MLSDEIKRIHDGNGPVEQPQLPQTIQGCSFTPTLRALLFEQQDTATAQQYHEHFHQCPECQQVVDEWNQYYNSLPKPNIFKQALTDLAVGLGMQLVWSLHKEPRRNY